MFKNLIKMIKRVVLLASFIKSTPKKYNFLKINAYWIVIIQTSTLEV